MSRFLANPYAAPEQPLRVPYIQGPLEMVTPPDADARVVSLTEAKTHCRVDISDDDDYIDALILAATAFCEQEIEGHRQFLTATYNVPIAGSWSGPLRLPRPPLQTVDSIKYYDSNGTLQTLSSSVYLVRTPWRAPGTIERAPYQWWPALQPDRRYPIIVQFTCGYGDAAADVPRTIKQAILLLVGHWYEHREAADSANVAASEPVALAVERLLASEGWGSYA